MAIHDDIVKVACSAQWEAERGGKNQHDAMEAAIDAAVLAERERCAKIAETLKTPSSEYDNGEIFFYGAFAQMHAKAIAATIRAVPPQQEEGE